MASISKFLLFIFVVLGQHAWAQKQPVPSALNAQPFTHVGFHLGGFSEFIRAIQIDDQGSKNLFNPSPFIGFSAIVPLNEQWLFHPELNWVLPQEVGQGVSKNIFMLRGDFSYAMDDWWRLRVGTSLMINNIRGSGGTQRMNNGDGSADFFVPAESKTAVNNTLDLGVEMHSDEFAARFQTYIYSLLKSDRRQYSLSLTLSYYYDLGN